MTWISLICLFALSSSALGRSAYGSYSAQDVLQRPAVSPVQTGYGQQSTNYGSYGSQPTQTVQFPSTDQSMISSLKSLAPLRGYGSGYQQQQQLFGDQPLQTVVPPPLSDADILCRGKQPETVIPLEDGRRFVVCLDDSKGEEQQCPKGLVFHPESRRCERRLGPLENPCSSQPCLNNGQCLAIDTSSYQCKCAPGFDGSICELDARVCQTQQPCGQAQGTRCQSFRANAAITYVCIHQNEFAYGFSAQQVVPSPCRGVDGAQALTITDKAFAMCDGERMFIESCPGGTLWDDSTKACVWPDMQGVTTPTQSDELLTSSSYGQQTLYPQSTYGSQQLIQQQGIQKPFELPVQRLSTYGSQQPITRQQDWQVSQYGGQQQQLPLIRQQDALLSPHVNRHKQHHQKHKPAVRQQDLVLSSYGSQQPIVRQQDLQVSQYDTQQQQPIFKQQDVQVSQYGSQLPISRPQELPVSEYGTQQQQVQQLPILRQQDSQVSQYGNQQQQQSIFKPQDLQVSQYGSQQPIFKQQDFQVSQYDTQQPIRKQQDSQISQYGSQQLQQPVTFQQPLLKQQDLRPIQQTSSY